MGEQGRRWSHRMALGAAAGLALLVVGCGWDLDSQPTSESDTTTTEADESSSTTSELAAPTTTRPEATDSQPDLPEGRDVEVTRITDGDTIRAGDERIRLIGIDTPEISGGVECYGAESAAALERLIPVGTTVRLVGDVTPRDRYDRTLAYVYRPSDGLHVNLEMAEDGYAVPLTVPPNVAHADDFADAARRAREAERGLWSACPLVEEPMGLAPATTPSTAHPATPETTTTAPAPAPTNPAPSDPPSAGSGCEPAYPDVCIPPAPPDLDCGDIPHRRFRVLPPDPHNFDGDGNGFGCERD